MLEGDDTRGRAFALFLRPHPGELCVLTPGNFPIFYYLFFFNADARGLAWGGWALLELTERIVAALRKNIYVICRLGGPYGEKL